MKNHLTTLFFLCICMLSINTQSVFAQGKTGTVVTLDKNNCTILYASTASSTTYFSFLRHNEIPVQIINANDDVLEENGTGLYKNMKNNISFDGNNIKLSNWANYEDDLYFAIIAPTGYNIARYEMDINSTDAQGGKIQEFTYNADGSSTTNIKNFNLNGQTSQKIDETKSGVNKLYFHAVFTSTSQNHVRFNTLKLTLTMDDSFEVTVPNDEGTTDVHTGMIDLGPFSEKTVNGGVIYTFNSKNVTDAQKVGLLDENGADVNVVTSTINGDENKHVLLLGNGTYYMEAPKKYRVTGANLTFLYKEVNPKVETTTTTTTEYRNVAFATGEDYLIGCKIGNTTYYLKRNNKNIIATTNPDEATKWTITKSGSNYTIKDSQAKYYLVRNGSGVECISTSETWKYDSSRGLYQTTGLFNITYHVLYYNSGFGITTSSNYNMQSPLYKKFTETQTSETTTPFAISPYTATVYEADGSTEKGPYNLSTSKDIESVPLSNLNNDGIKFTISGLTEGTVAPFLVSLNLSMLDPYIQTIETAYLNENDGEVSSVSSSSENLKFNNGETIVVPIPSIYAGDENKTYQLVFRNAYNDNRTSDYTGTPSGTGQANYFLIDYENSTTGKKTDVDGAGTTLLPLTNIQQVSAGTAERLEDIDYDKTTMATQAGYNSANTNLKNNQESSLLYIYSADEPIHQIVPNGQQHIAYAYYEIKVKPYVVKETPLVAVTTLYESTLKGANNKNTSITKDSDVDTNHHFFGVRVTSQTTDPNFEATGTLTSKQIIDAIQETLVSREGIYSTDDPFRTILYLDLSELHTVSDAGEFNVFRTKTADNCLYFMPKNYNSNLTNVIAGGENGEAVGDIIILDQQPFYTPFTFKTGTHEAKYERAGTNGKDPSKNTTLVLPFDIPLSDESHPMTHNNQVNEKVTFYTLSNGDHVGTSADYLDAIPVVEIASANTPYHIKSTSEDASYVIQLTNATFKTTPNEISETNGSLIGYGNFNGVAVNITENIYYFSKNYFWNSSTLTNGSTTIKILPYRVYYKAPTAPSNVSSFSIKFLDGTNGMDSEESLVSEDGGFPDAIKPMQNENTKVVWYNLNGQKMNNRPTLPGIYVVNGKKVLIK